MYSFSGLQVANYFGQRTTPDLMQEHLLPFAINAYDARIWRVVEKETTRTRSAAGCADEPRGDRRQSRGWLPGCPP